MWLQSKERSHQLSPNQGIRKLASGKHIDLHPCRHITFHGIALHTSRILLTCMQGILFPIISHKIPWYPIKSRSDWWFFRMRYTPPTPSSHCQVAKDRFGKEVFLLRSALNGQTVEPGTLVGFTVGKPGGRMGRANGKCWESAGFKQTSFIGDGENYRIFDQTQFWAPGCVWKWGWW